MIYMVYMPSWEDNLDETCYFSTREKAEEFIRELAKRPDCNADYFRIKEKELDLQYSENEHIILPF